MNATAEVPASLFQVAWDAGDRAAGSRVDTFSLYEKKWQWSSRSLHSDRRESIATAASLREIGAIFARHFREGEAERASFVCGPAVEGVDSEGLEDEMEIFPLDEILQEIAPVFSRTGISPLEYGNRRNWFVYRSTFFRPDTGREPTDKCAHHLFWFPTPEPSRPPQLLFFNVRPPRPGDPPDRWSGWEIALVSDEAVLHSVWQNDVGTGAISAILDRGRPGATTFEFLQSVSPSWRKLPSGELTDSWGNLIVPPSADWDALDLELERDDRATLEDRPRPL